MDHQHKYRHEIISYLAIITSINFMSWVMNILPANIGRPGGRATALQLVGWLSLLSVIGLIRVMHLFTRPEDK